MTVLDFRQRARLVQLHALRARVDAEIATIERSLRITENRTRQRRGRFITHGTNRGCQWHWRHGEPFPEDSGGEPCGCREAHAAYEAQRARSAKARRREEVAS